MTSSKLDRWADLILSTSSPEEIWTGIFERLHDIAIDATSHLTLDKESIIPDRLLAESAWNLWEEFPNHAPTVTASLKDFWVKTQPSGTAILILDGLSLREMYCIVREAKRRNIALSRTEALACEAPTETKSFAETLGLSSRSQIANNKAPASFVFRGEDTYTDVLDAPFEDCVSMIPPTERIFVWHVWPDFPLIDENGKSLENAPEIARKATNANLSSDGFWDLVNRLRQGRRLVITSDHGYGIRDSFSNEEKDPKSINLLREHFKARRCAPEAPGNPWPRRNLPPLACRHNGQIVVMGQRWWSIQGGFPLLFHGGLSLLEATVPYIQFEAA